jgi:hypothetical protein
MTESPSVIAAATALAEWARERRRTWTDDPLPAPAWFLAAAEVSEGLEEVDIEEVDVEDIAIEEELAEQIEAISEPALTPIFTEEVAEELEPGGPSFFETIADGLKTVAVNAVETLAAALERLRPLGEPAIKSLVRGGAIVSTLSVLLVVGLNSGRLFSRWDRVAAMVIAATNRPPTEPAPVVAPPSGSGRLNVASLNGAAQVLVDGTPRGLAPITLDLPAGAHRVLLRSEKGSVERAIRIQAGESSEIKEAIFPGWIALMTPIDLSLSEDGHPLRRDERGWAILAPGPHDIHLDNRVLGVHEVRRVVVTPGDTTRLSFAPHASTLSLTTNEPADVWIDGASFGQSPLVDQPITLGVHDVRVRSAVHERWLRVRATVQPVTVNVDLTAN